MRRVGVEEELLLVDPTTGVPVAVAGAILKREADENPEEQREPATQGDMEAELQQQQVEVESSPCQTLAEVGDQLRSWRQRADRLARASKARIAALATSPLAVTPETSVQPRYLRMVEHFGLTTVEQLTCGCHVHVAVESEHEGVAVIDRVRPWLPVLLALSANSPYWQGHDSGYASFRSQAWLRFPTAGPVDVFGSAERYHHLVETLISTGVVLDHGMIYFDARLSHRYPTVEIRVADVCLLVDDAVLIAGLTRALVETAVREWRAGVAPMEIPTDLLRLAMWRAGRSGIRGDLIDPRTGQPKPAVTVVAELVQHVEEALVTTGDQRRVVGTLDRVWLRGTGASVQRSTHRRTGLLREVVREAAEESTR